jgi:hypothetical protein
MTKTYGLTDEQKQFIETLHGALTAHAELLNRSSLTHQDVGGKGFVKNPAECLTLLNGQAQGKPARTLRKGFIGSLYIAHADSPFRVLPENACQDKTLILSCWTLSNAGGETSPALSVAPQKMLSPLRIEIEPESNKILLLQDFPDGKEVKHGDFSLAKPGDFNKIMAIIRKQTNALRLTAISNEVLHPLPNKIGENPSPDADPNKDSLLQRKQVMDTLVAYIHAYYPTPENIFVNDNDRAYGGYPLQLFRERNGFRAPQGLEGCTLELTLNPQDNQKVRTILKRTSETGESSVIAALEGDRITFLRDPVTQETSYAALKKIVQTLPLRVTVDYDFTHS